MQAIHISQITSNYRHNLTQVCFDTWRQRADNSCIRRAEAGARNAFLGYFLFIFTGKSMGNKTSPSKYFKLLSIVLLWIFISFFVFLIVFLMDIGDKFTAELGMICIASFIPLSFYVAYKISDKIYIVIIVALVFCCIYIVIIVLQYLFSSIYFAAYFIFTTITTFYMTIKYKKFLHPSSIGFITITIFLFLIFTGFCFKSGKYLSKNEIIDTAIKINIQWQCQEEYKHKYIGDNVTTWSYVQDDVDKKCSISLEGIKQEAPQCFTNKRADTCNGTVTLYDKKTHTLKTSYLKIYSYMGSKFNKISHKAYTYYPIHVFDLIDANKGIEKATNISPCGKLACPWCH
jgi:hypothetical protein